MVAVAATFTKEMSPSPPSSGSLIKINLQKLLDHFCQFSIAFLLKIRPQVFLQSYF
jgi:hypothetical protein